MNKPLAPKKPLKHSSPPSEFETIEKVVMFNYKTKELVLVNIDYREKSNEEEGMSQYEVDGLENFGERLKYSDVIKFKNLLPQEVEDFTIEEQTNRDGYHEYTYLTYKVKKHAAKYQKELEDFNNRFLQFDKEYKIYQNKLKEYEEIKKQNKILKLKEELEKIS